MKKITVVLLLLISANCFAQIPTSTLDSIKPNVICFNENVRLYGHFTGSWGSTNQAPLLDSAQNVIANITYQEWVDSNFVVSVTIVSAFITTGTHRVSLPSATTFTYRNLTVNNCTYAIEQYNSKEDLMSTQYYNLLGQPVKEPDGICIEVKTYVGGQREIRKIISAK